MANLPMRRLGEIGVITDANPYDLPLNAFTDCNNVVFDGDRVSRAPVFKPVFPAIRSAISIHDYGGTCDGAPTAYDSAEGAPVENVRFVGSYADPSAGETLFICDNSGEVRGYPDGNLTFMNPGEGLITNNAPWSHAQVSGLSFLARKGMKPYVRNVQAVGGYAYMTGDWGTNDHATVIRGYLDYVLCLGVTKAGVEYPTTVKWSNPLPYNSAIADVQWDMTNPAYVAGENPIGQLTSPLRDGLALRNSFVLYSQDQVWLMEYTGSSFVFNFRPLFPQGGIINTNCVVEVEGKHYVFGEDDIYVHDGMTKQSLADGRIRRSLFNTLDRDRKTSCFVHTDPVNNLILFCYPTKQDEVNYKHTPFCNKAAVYNYKSNTWSFMDLPNVPGGAAANIAIDNNQYVELGQGSFELYNTSYATFDGAQPRLTVMLGATHNTNGLTESRVYALDAPSAGLVNLTAHPETFTAAFVERSFIDLDDAGMQLPLRSNKFIKTIVPQVVYSGKPGTLRWKLGGTMLPSDTVKWSADVPYTPERDYKIDMRVSGRYLAYRVEANSVENFKLSGFDASVAPLSYR